MCSCASGEQPRRRNSKIVRILNLSSPIRSAKFGKTSVPKSHTAEIKSPETRRIGGFQVWGLLAAKHSICQPKVPGHVKLLALFRGEANVRKPPPGALPRRGNDSDPDLDQNRAA